KKEIEAKRKADAWRKKKESEAKRKADALRKKKEIEAKRKADALRKLALKREAALVAARREKERKEKLKLAKARKAEREAARKAAQLVKATNAMLREQARKAKIQAKEDAKKQREAVRQEKEAAKKAAKDEAIRIKQELLAARAAERAAAEAAALEAMPKYKQERVAREAEKSRQLWLSLAGPSIKKPASSPLERVVQQPAVQPKQKDIDVKLNPDRPFLKITKTQGARYLKAFTRREIELQSKYKEAEEHLKTVTAALSDVSSRRDLVNDGNMIDDEYSIALVKMKDAEVRLQMLSDARVRFNESRFGRCFRCYADIPVARMEIYPEYDVCKDCTGKEIE
ncbi:MAG: hypothetical protein ACKOW9_03580, partial [Candidatus Paceibacterota bacterium]